MLRVSPPPLPLAPPSTLPIYTPFKPTIISNERLLTIINAVLAGQIVLPEFQRKFLWSRDQIEALLISMFRCVHVGTFLMLDMLASEAIIPYRHIEGLAEVNPQAVTTPRTLIREVLDGQQRITSLFYALHTPPIPLRGALHPHKFYLRLDRVLVGNIDDAVVGLSQRTPKQIREMATLIEEGNAVAISTFRDPTVFNKWLYTQQTRWLGAEQQYLAQLYDNFAQYSVPVAVLSVETEVDTIVATFERLNLMGTSLSIFDLGVAIAYRNGVRLNDLWTAFETTYPEVASTVKRELLLKVVTLHEGREARPVFMLDTLSHLAKDAFLARWQEAVEAVLEAYERIVHHYGALRPRWMPHSSLIMPLAVILYRIRQQNGGVQAYEMVDRWYWMSVFGQRYDSSADSQAFVDIRLFDAWLADPTVDLPWMTPLEEGDLDLDVADSKSAVYRGIICLLALAGARDFMTGQDAHLNKCEDDHIFADKRYSRNHRVDLIYNRTLLSATTNKRKTNKPPGDFLSICLTEHGGDVDRLHETLATHFITPTAYAALLAENFDAFVAARRAAFVAAINARLPGQSNCPLDNGQ